MIGSVDRFASSMMRLSWAGVLFGAGQLAQAPRAPRSLDALTLAARRRLDLWPQAIFQVGDDFQAELWEVLPRDLSAASWRRFAERFAADAVASLAVMRPDLEGTAARQELLDKAEVYVLVRRASASLGEEGWRRERFEAAVERAFALDPRHALWVIEGLGHGHTAAAFEKAALERSADPVGLLVGARVPESARMMAHLGLGMALAERVFAHLDPYDALAASRAVDRFVALCRANSEPGHEDAALESLGLVVRCFFPELVPSVGRATNARAPGHVGAGEPGDLGEGDLGEYFWHGVGRAVYFLPLHLVPGYGTIEAALRRVEQEAPRGRALAAARAGVAYAATLVNLGRPVVLERFARRSPEAFDASFVEGLVSAVLLRAHTTPGAAELETFLDHRPEPGETPEDVAASEFWLRRVIEPVHDALLGGGAGPGAGAVHRKLREAAP